MRPGFVRGLSYAQPGHVLVELELLDRREGVRGCAGPGRRGIEHVVDVGHVATQLDLDTGGAQYPRQGVHPQERRGVAEVGHVVRRDAAGVDPGPIEQAQPAVAQLEHHGERHRMVATGTC